MLIVCTKKKNPSYYKCVIHYYLFIYETKPKVFVNYLFKTDDSDI